MRGYLCCCKSLLSTSPDFVTIFQSFLSDCYQTFYREILPLKRYDGLWVAPVLDHLCMILCKLAVLADGEE